MICWWNGKTLGSLIVTFTVTHWLPWSPALGKAGGLSLGIYAPLPKALRLLFACTFALLSYSRLDAGLVVQQAKGLRPSEMLNIKGCDIFLPAAQCFGNQDSVAINFGARGGTKSKRAQAARQGPYCVQFGN